MKKTNTIINNKSYYRITKTIGHKADGTPIKKQFYGTSKSEAEEKATSYINELKLGVTTKDGVLTINSIFKDWLFTYKKNELKRSTLETYESLYRIHIEPDIISARPLRELKSIHIQSFYERLLNNNVSVKRIRAIHKLLHVFCAYLAQEGYIIRNLCENVTIPKENFNPSEIIKKQFDYFTIEELRILLEAFKNSSYYNIVLFAIGTGMRQGEILGLQWSDVDFENRTIHVLHNLSNGCDFENGKRIYNLKLTTPKSKNAVRTIPMSDTIYELLKNQPRTNTMVFPSKQNTYINSKNLLKVWQRKLKEAGLRYRTFHDLRHTFATMTLANRS